MKPSSPYLNREEQAMREVGQTTIRPATAWVLVAVFLAVIYAAPLIQQFHDVRAHLAGERGRPDSPRGRDYDIFRRGNAAFAVLVQTPGSPLARVFAANRQLLREMHAYEDALEDESAVGQMLRPPVQYVLSRWLGAGNEKAYCGVRPWLFYRADVDYLTSAGFLNPIQLVRRAAGGNEWTSAPQPDPRPAILDFKQQLAQRGIQLIVMPVPPKSSIQPENFSCRFEPGATVLQNPSYAAFIRELKLAGVLVADVTPVFTGMWSSPGVEGDPYLATDTHWRPEAVERAARYLKQYINEKVKLPSRSDAGYRAQTFDVTNRGDLAVMLRLPEWTPGYPPEAVCLRQILTSRGETWLADETSDVLVLGDSFCNIYSLDAMGWGESAGLIEQLSFELQRPLDRLVIWQFAMRELASGDWKSVTLNIGKPVPSLFVVPVPGKDLSVRGVVRAMAPVPRPGTVPYKDHIVAVHIMDVECGEQAIQGNQALIYLQSMRDNVWTPAARLRPGDSVMVRLHPWTDVAPRYERINRTELPGDALQLAEPCWGELMPVGR